MQKDKIEVVVVFKQDVEFERAQDLLTNTGQKFREGMDSSRGKLYFYKTGPKFIVTFENEQEENRFITEYEQLDEIHEIYTPDWTIQKD